MKKSILKVLITLAMVLAFVLSMGATESDAPRVIQPGDVNADGDIDSSDIVLLAQYIAGWDVQLGGDMHSVVIDEAVEPTCRTTGLTEGKHCSDCGMILVKQQILPTTDHDFEDTVYPPTETEKGYTRHRCMDCGFELIDSYTGATLAKGLEYEIIDGNCTITGIGTCTETEIYIPENIENCPVTAIADEAFAEQTQITFITIPYTVESLGSRAFYGCTGLTEFTVPSSVISIGHQVFYKCDNLATVYYNSRFSPDTDKVFLNIESIKTVIFGGTIVPKDICYKCSNIKNIKILKTVKSIGYEAFYGCSSLTSVTIPDSVTSINYSVFEGCSSLTSVTIPDSVTSISNDAFIGCSSLKNLYISDLESWLNVKLNGNFSHPLYSAGGNLYINNVLATDITIPDSVTRIGNFVFNGCSSLTSVTIPGSVMSIGNYAFDGCSSLTSVTIPDSVTRIGNFAFRGCRSLESIIIPDSVTSIGNYVFRDCSRLMSITIPDSVTSIGDAAFSGCSSLTSVTIPDSVTSIGYEAFYGCSSLTSVTIPDSVTSIGNSAFWGCSSLKKVYYGGTESDWSGVAVGNSNEPLSSAIRYYYSENKPMGSGLYWRYVDGVPTPW